MRQNHALCKQAEVCDVTMLTRFYSPGRTKREWVYPSPCREAKYTFQMFVMSQSFARSGVQPFPFAQEV